MSGGGGISNAAPGTRSQSLGGGGGNHCVVVLSGHLDAQPASRPFIHIVGDGDGGRYFAKVGHEAPVEAAHPLRSDNVPEEAPGVGLLLGQQQLGPGLGLQLCPGKKE